MKIHNEKGLTCWHAAEYTIHIIYKKQNCEPIDLSRFVVDLRERYLEYWTPYSDMRSREHNSKHSTYHQWCALPTRRALGTHSPYILCKYMFLNLPGDVIRSAARFRLRVHTLCFETATWNRSNSPNCDMCDTDNVQDEQHIPFHCVNPLVISFLRNYASLFPPTGAHDMSNLLS
jgi:hypothetical protein